MNINEEFREATLKKFANNVKQPMTVLERMVLDKEAIPENLLKKLHQGIRLKDDEFKFIVAHIRGLENDDFSKLTHEYKFELQIEGTGEFLAWYDTKDMVEKYINLFGNSLTDPKVAMHIVKRDVENIIFYTRPDLRTHNRRYLKYFILNSFFEKQHFLGNYAAYDPILEFIQIEASEDGRLARSIIYKVTDEVLKEQAAARI